MRGSLGGQLRGEGLSELLSDFGLTCTGGIPTPQGADIPAVNITISLNTSLTSRLLANNVSEALLVINDPEPGNQLLRDPISWSQSKGSGLGGSPSGTSYDGSLGHPNILQGTITEPNQVTFYSVPIDPPGSLGAPYQIPTLSLRVTNMRAAASELGFPISLAGVSVTAAVSSSAGFPIANPVITVNNIYYGINPPPSPAYPVDLVSQQAVFPQCTGQSFQQAFIAVANEGFAQAFKPRFSRNIASESIPGSYPLPESGFLISGAPLAVTSPGVADFGTRVKLQLGNVPAGVSIYVPLAIGSGIYHTNENGVQTLTAALTSSEAGPFSAVAASQGTGGLMALVSGGSAIYEVVTASASSPLTMETLSIPVYVSYAATTPATFPLPGITTAAVSLAPNNTNGEWNAGPNPRFIDTSTPSTGFTIAACAVSTLTSKSGTPQSAAVNTAFATPLQALLRDSNGVAITNSPVTFTVPVAAAGGIFVGGGNIVMAQSNAQGINTSPAIIANGTAGTYNVVASNGTLSANFSLTNLPGISTIFFSAIPSHFVSDLPFYLSASASLSTAPITFTVLSGPAFITGKFLAITGAGTVTVQASQAATANYQASTATQSFLVTSPVISSQFITFASIPDHNTTDAPFTVSAIASSGLAVQFSILSGPATMAGNLVTLTGAGTINIGATQLGNSVYPAAAPVSNHFRVFGPGPSVTSLLNGGYTSSVVAPDSLGEIFGTNLGNDTLTAPAGPFPAQMGGLTLILTDAAGTATPLLLYYVSPTQINFMVPPTVAMGTGTLVITNGAARTATQNVTVSSISPGIFTVNGSGTGAFAGQTQSFQSQTYFTLYGTGFRHAKSISVTVAGLPAQVLYSGSQSQFPGLDQLNVAMPASALSGMANMVLTVDGITANPVTVTLP